MALQALLVWCLLALFLTGLQWQVLGAMPALGGLPRRLVQLLSASFWVWVAPTLLCVPLFGFFRGEWQRGLKYGLNWSLSFLMTSAALWAGLGFLSVADSTDPWENLPEVTPPYLEGFVAAHPDIEVLKVDGTRRVRITHRKDGGWMWVDGNDLPGSRVRFERCTTPPTAEALGGLLPYPGATCKQVLTLTRPQAQRVVYKFELTQGVKREAIQRFYTDWAAARQASASLTGGPTRFDFKAEQGGRRWDFWLFDGRAGWSTLYIEQGGRAKPWPEGSADSTY